MAKKKSSLLTKAKKLGNSKYAAPLADLQNQRSANRQGYTAGSSQRVTSVDKEIGSINAATATTNKRLDDSGNTLSSAYKQSMDSTAGNNAQLNAAIQSNNSNLLSILQADAKSRGLDPSLNAGSSALTAMVNQKALMDAQQANNTSYLESKKNSAALAISLMKGQTDMLGTSAASLARGKANSEIVDMYNTYLKEKARLKGLQTTTKLEKGDYINQLYMTMKDKAAAAKADRAARAWDKKLALMQLGMKSDQFNAEMGLKQDKLKVDTQLEYDKLSSLNDYRKDINRLKKSAQGDKVKIAAANNAEKALDRLEKIRHNKATEANDVLVRNATQLFMDTLLAAKGK